MDVSRWLDKVPGLLHLYYPGQEGGTAVAQILFGQHNPEGKLPVSFDRSWDENPRRSGTTATPRTTPRCTPPAKTASQLDYTIEHIKYGDKLMVGYRYWTTTGRIRSSPSATA
jgi:beta-glucosidase